MIEVQMASKTLSVIAIILAVVVVLLFVDTHLLFGPLADKIPFPESEATGQAILRVDGYVYEPNAVQEHVCMIAYSVLNMGNLTAENVTITAAVDGESQATHLVSSLSVSESANYSLVV